MKIGAGAPLPQASLENFILVTAPFAKIATAASLHNIQLKVAAQVMRLRIRNFHLPSVTRQTMWSLGSTLCRVDRDFSIIVVA